MNTTATSTEVVFVGDSLTQWFQREGKPYWKKYFVPLRPVNVGVAGDTTDNILQRLRTGLLGSLTSARVSVLLAGTNDIGWSHEPLYIFDRLGEIVKVLQTELPGTKVLVLGILPRGSLSKVPPLVNQLLTKLDDGDGVRFLDMTPQFSLPGQIALNPKLYSHDGLHLSPEGYRVWAETMWPHLEAMLKK